MSEELTKTTAQRMKMNLELLQQLAVAVAANEKAQRRFRAAIVSRVAKIETTIQFIFGAQIAQAHDCIESEKMLKHAKDAEETISKASDKLGLAMVEFIYGESGETAPRRGRKGPVAEPGGLKRDARKV